MRGWSFRVGGQREGSKVKAPKTSGGGRTPVRHAIPLGIVIFLVFQSLPKIKNKGQCIQLFSYNETKKLIFQNKKLQK